jgi:predicted helicase
MADTGDQALAIRRVVPAAPQYFFAPRPAVVEDEYAGSPRLPDLMPVNVTAPVTARDGFVVAFSREELLARMAEFRDLNVDDDEIRRRYFTTTRSAKYAAGDTRGWKLAEARRRVAADAGWQEHVRPCWYRPFDERVVYWADRMIDWPRDEVTQYLLRPGNMALVARRQMLPTQPCNYFWITDQLLLDGLIRSDNRGSESVFPLFLEPAGDGCGPRYRRNFDEAFLVRAARQMGIRWQSDGEHASDGFRLGDLLFYSYALFFSPEYRRRYADRLWSDFPRVLLPRRPDLFRALAGFGERLASWHLLRGLRSVVSAPITGAAAIQGSSDWRWSVNAVPVIAPGFPKYGSGRVSINRDVWLETVPTEIWDFHAGGHQVCRKWLKDRRGRTLADGDLAVYFGIVSAIGDTLRTMTEIDAAVQAAGGWPTAFVPHAVEIIV